LAVATKNFRKDLGEGGFGRMYKGQMKNGQVIAICPLRKAKALGALKRTWIDWFY